ncbi:MAG TPA: hypothetical protein VE133_14175 [Candidatus Sulfotelmatobacter sp.]|jgi:hypothetical protein|nr:hypothetical protein [Candidatus Sulfotelmatobacter sp.]
MAANKAIRSNPVAQPQRRNTDHQIKTEIFEILRRLNRGYGLALAALDKLDSKDRNTRRVFPAGFLHEYRTRTEVLRAQANRDLLHRIAEREEQEAEHLVNARK